MDLGIRTWITVLTVTTLSMVVAHAQQKPAPLSGNYPSKPVRVLTGQSPGGGGDLLGRLVSQKLTERAGQTFYVENIPGASGILALNVTAKADPDGYTIFIASSASINQAAIIQNIDVRRLLAPVAQLTSTPNALSISAALPAKNLREFVAYAKARPGQLNFASGGIGSSSHIVAELLKYKAGIDLVHIPFKGVSPALQDVVAGRSHAVFASGTATTPHVKTGKLRAIAISSNKRSPSLPDLPTIAEQGYPDFDYAGWIGFLTTAGTPRPIIDALNRAVVQALSAPDVQKILASDGSDAAPGTADDLKNVMETSLVTMANLVKMLNLKLE